LAPCRVSDRIGAGIAAPLRPTNGVVGNSPADPRDEHRQPVVGSAENPWRASQARIEIGQTSVTKYMARRRGSPSQGWKTFLRNHADGIVAMDLFVVPKSRSDSSMVADHGPRPAADPVVWVTAHPTDEWIANQLTEAVAGSKSLVT